MKYFYSFSFIAIMLITVSCAGKNGVRFKELGYGRSAAKILSKDEVQSSPSGNFITGGTSLNILKTTDVIEAKLGSQFGVEYILNAKSNETIPVMITWTFPEGMRDLNGKPVKKYSYYSNIPGNTYSYVMYMLENENEVVPGEWKVSIKYRNKKLYSKTFHLE